MKQLLFAFEQVLTQLRSVVEAVTLEDYSRASPALGGSTIGQHVRHTLEFFICLEHGIRDGVINYDRRAHDKLLEKDNALAAVAIQRIHEFVYRQRGDGSLVLEAGYLRDSDESCIIRTNFQRELAYNIEHAVHHMAIIKIGLRDVAPYVALDDSFGVAASTVRHDAAFAG